MKTHDNPQTLRILALFSLLTIILSVTKVHAQQPPIVHAVLFYSKTCPHCHKVITEDLPPLIEKYQDQLVILLVEVGTPQGQQLYQSAINHYQIPDDRLGVPTLIVGENVLVGSLEIPEFFPDIVANGLVEDGVDWPEIPGLEQIIDEISQENSPAENQNQPATETGDNTVEEPSVSNDLQEYSVTTTILSRFYNDFAGNSIAVLTLVGMILSVLFAGYIFLNDKSSKTWPEWSIIVLSIIGLGVAAYLTFVETTQSEAVCGPVGDCNTVQQSSYAMLFGVIPIGLLGIIGYVLIISAWIIRHFTTSSSLRKLISIAVWIMAWFGVFFSIYLTFLEPFVIGATCMWCITSSVVMTLILIATTPYAKSALFSEMSETRSIDTGENPV